MRLLLAACAALLLTAFSAEANVKIEVDKDSQRMTVYVDGALRYTWPVSTGSPGYSTPSGEFTPSSMEKEHFSKEWDDAPMPHSIFFTAQGHAIHGSSHTKRLGRPVSHGCVRLAPANATLLYELVTAEGMENTRVVIIGVEFDSVPHGGYAGVDLGPMWQKFYQP